MEKAELALVTSDLSIKSIAQLIGYSDYSYFNRVFKQNSGITPLQYREKALSLHPEKSLLEKK